MRELNKTAYFISFPLSFIMFIFPIFASSLGLSAIEIGYLFSIFSVVGIIIRPMVGKLIDKRGRKIGILIGTVLYTLVNLFFILSKDFKLLLVGRIVQSLAASFLWISVDTYISDISNKTNRGENFGSLEQNIAKGGMVGSIIGFTILINNITVNPFKTIFIIFFCTGLISVFYTIKKIPETITLKKEQEKGKIKDMNNFKYFLVIIGVIAFISNLTGPIYMLYLQSNITNDIIKISYMFIPGVILTIFLPKKFGAISDRYGREKIVIIGMFVNAILQILIPFNQSYYGFIIIYTLICAVGIIYGPAFSSLIIDFVGENKRGRSYGLYSFASGVGAAIGPIVGSYVYEKVGKDIVFYLNGGLMIVMVFLICYIYSKKVEMKSEIDVSTLN